MKKHIVILMLLFVGCIPVFSQNPIRWRTSVKMTSPTEGVIVIKALIKDGWHLYGLDLPDGGPKATSFDFSRSEGIRLMGKVTASAQPISKKDEMFGIVLSWWEADVSFTQKFRLTEKDRGKVNCMISYMGCDNATCLPPKTENISVVVPAYR